MRTFVLCARIMILALVVVGLTGCEALRDFTGINDGPLRLLLYASPRQPPSTDGEILSLVGVEAVQGSNRVLREQDLCVRLTAQRGQLTSATGTGGGNQDALSCGGTRCLLFPLPSDRPRRAFAIYTPETGSPGDLLLAELFLLSRSTAGEGGTGDGGTEAGPACTIDRTRVRQPDTSTALTFGVPDAPVPDQAPPGDGVPPLDAGTDDALPADLTQVD